MKGKGSVFFKRAAVIGLSLVLTFSSLPMMNSTRAEAEDDGIVVEKYDLPSYSPTTIVNGDFQKRPWVKYKVAGSHYESEWSDADEVSEQTYTILAESWGLGDDYSHRVPVTSVCLNDVNEGWNTTERSLQFGDLFEWINGKLQGDKNNPNGTPAGKSWGTYNSKLIDPTGENFFVELNATHPGVLYQDLTTHPGDVIRWSLKHGGRTDVTSNLSSSKLSQDMRVEIGAPAKNLDPNASGKTTMDPYASNTDTSASSEVRSNIDSDTLAKYTKDGVTNPTGKSYGSSGTGMLKGLSIAWDDCENGWQSASGAYIVPEGQGVTRFAFISETNDDLDHGNLLDDIEFSTLFGNLTVSRDETDSDNPKTELTGYWGDTDTAKKLVIETDNSKTQKINLDSLITAGDDGKLQGSGFKITISDSVIDTLDPKTTSISVYHEDYPLAKIKFNLHIHSWKAEATDPDSTGKQEVKIYCSDNHYLGENSAATCPCNGKDNAGTVSVSAEDDVISAGSSAYSYNKSAKITQTAISDLTNIPAESASAGTPDDLKPVKISDYEIYKVGSNGSETGAAITGAIKDPGKYVVKKKVTIGSTSVYAKDYFCIKEDYTPTVSCKGWTYGETPTVPTPSGLPAGYPKDDTHLKYTYYTDSSCSTKTTTANSGALTEGGRPVNAGQYYVKLTTKSVENKYDGKTSKAAVFKVYQAPIEPVIKLENWVFDNGTGTHTPSVTPATGKTLGDAAKTSYVYTYYTDSSLGSEFKTTTDKTNGSGAATVGGQPVNPGNYWVEVVIPETTNYYQGEAKCSFTISKVSYVPTVTIQDWVYRDTPKDPVLNGVPDGIPLSSISFEYYKDEIFSQATTEDDGAKRNGGVPSEVGEYWVKMTVPETKFYSGAWAKNKFKITQATYTPSITIDDWTYGGTPSSTVVTGDTRVGEIGNGYTYTYYTDDAYTIRTTSANGAQTAGGKPSKAGKYYLELTIAGSDKYGSQSARTQFEIKKAPLVITIDNKSIELGTKLPSLTYKVSGLVNGDTEAIIKGGLQCDYTNSIGEYPIVNKDITAGANYTVTFINGTLTIYKLPVAKPVKPVPETPAPKDPEPEDPTPENPEIPENPSADSPAPKDPEPDDKPAKKAKLVPYFQMVKEIKIGRSFRFDVTNVNKKATVTYKSGNKKVATVSKKGVIKARKNGTAKITCTIKQNKLTYKFIILVVVTDGKFRQFSLSEDRFQLPESKNPMLNIYKLIGIGKPFKFALKNFDKDAEISYVSEDESVATISSQGVITGHKVGFTPVRIHVEQRGNTYDYMLYVRVTNGKYNYEMLDHLAEK